MRFFLTVSLLVVGTFTAVACATKDADPELVVRAPGVLVGGQVQVGSAVVGELDYPMPLGGLVNGAFQAFLGESPFDDIVELRVLPREWEMSPGTYEVRVVKEGFVVETQEVTLPAASEEEEIFVYVTATEFLARASPDIL